MTKTIFKELIITLLLCLVIILVLGILLYEYVPTTKTIPNTAAYVTPNNVKEELAESEEIDEDQIIMTYQVNSNDLNNFKRIQNYRPGKANPFSSYEVTSTNGEQTGENGSSTGGSSTGGSTQNENTTTSSGGQFFQDKGTK